MLGLCQRDGSLAFAWIQRWSSNADKQWQCKSVPKTRGFSRSWVSQSKWCSCHQGAAHELCPECRSIFPDALLLPQTTSFSRNEQFLTKKFSLRNFYKGSIYLPTFFKNLWRFYFLEVGKNPYLYSHHHQVICILGYVKASFIFDLKSSSTFIN